ncbi:MGC78790 protein, related [Neospora caninum Liverpool]|uniref:MGC78790 protein, related n=1 Tax=Neospora caninum (strain Liverpool) TaxID=572307 RepID=F0VJN9_NEOCL|nr:MGC78790 protein, related [Neospora caninum Liverpool]CBZ53950.1 MGC78790 protein, related [Neospora caninum Liverpool]|eukprot:XP_003883982.1 MGC78790 protein, related [Neospora caninum Liverpool]
MAVTHRGDGAVLLIFPEIMRTEKIPSIVDFLLDKDFDIIREKEFCFTHTEAARFFEETPASTERSVFISQVCSGLVRLQVLQHPEGLTVSRLLDVVGPEDVQEAKKAQESGHPKAHVFEPALPNPFILVRFVDRCPVERTFAMIKPDAVAAGAFEQIRDEILDSGLDIICQRHLRLTETAVDAVYEEHKDKPFFDDLRLFLTGSDGVAVLILEGQAAIRRWTLLCGPADSARARRIAKGTLRARFGSDATQNAVHGSGSAAEVERAMRLFFTEPDFALERTFALIKPDGMAAAIRHSILEEIQKKRMQIICRKEFQLDKQGILQLYAAHHREPYFAELSEFLASGPVTALILMRVGAVAVWRDTVGVRKDLTAPPRGKSLRGLYSKNRLRNVVHASETRNQAEQSIAFFFPELPLYPIPQAEYINDYVFLKRAAPGKTIEREPVSRGTVPPTLQILISKGLEALCAVKPQGLAAVSYLADWLEKNARQQDVGRQLTVDPTEPPKRTIITVEEGKEMPHVLRDSLPRPPFFVRIVGGPLSGKQTLSKRIADETGFVALSFKDVAAKEIASKSALGQLLEPIVRVGEMPPASVEARLWKSAFLEHSGNNRVVITSSRLSLERAKSLDRELGGVPALVVFIGCPRELLVSRAAKAGALAHVEQIDESLQHLADVKEYYQRLGKVFVVDGALSAAEMFQQVRHLFLPVVTYLLAPPGLPSNEIAKELEGEDAKHVDVLSLLQDRARPVAVAHTLTSASAVCPLLVDNLRELQNQGNDQFVITDFPLTVKQMRFVEEQVPCTVRAVRIRASPTTLKALENAGNSSLKALETRRKAFRSQDMNAVFADLEARRVLQTVDCDVLRECPLAATSRSVGRRLLDLLSPLGPRATIVVGPPGYDAAPLALALSKYKKKALFLDCDALQTHALETGSCQTLPAMADPRTCARTVRAALHRMRSESAVLINLPRTWGDAELSSFDESVHVEQVVRVRGASQLDPASRPEDTEAQRRFLQIVTQYFNKKLKVIEVRNEADRSAEDLATEIVRGTQPSVVAVGAPPTIDTRDVAKSLCDILQYKILPDIEALVPSVARAEMRDLSQKKMKAVLDSPSLLAATVAKALKADAELQGCGCVLLGYPKTVEQASALLKHGVKLEKFVQVTISAEAVLQRLSENEDPPEVDQEELESSLNAYYVNEDSLSRFFEARGELVKLDGTSATLAEACAAAFRPRVVLFPSAHLHSSLARQVASAVAKTRHARVVDVAQFHVPETRKGAAPEEGVFRDLPLDSEAGVFAQLLQLQQACTIDGLVLLDLPAAAFDTLGCLPDLVETLALSVPQVVQHAYTVNDLLFSVLGENVKDKVRLTLRSDQTIKEIKATVKAQLGPAAELAATRAMN